MSKGYVKLHRKIKDSWITKDPAAFVIFFGYFLIRAAYEPYTTTVNGQKVDLERGEVVGGRGMIAEAMNLTEKQVRMALVRLVRRETIRASTRASTRASNFTVYLVVNFDTYQGGCVDDGPALCDGAEKARASFIEDLKEVKRKKKREGADALANDPLVFLDQFPEAFQSSAQFKEAWGKWVQHRREQGKPLHKLKTGAAESIRQIGSLSPDHAVEVINKSLRNSWQGLIPERVPKPEPKVVWEGGYIPSRLAL